MITTTVASRAGASSVPTMPPETMKPKLSVAKRAAHSTWLSAYLAVPKNRMIGRKSSRNFIRGGRREAAVPLLRREVYRGRVDAETLAGRLRAVVEHVAQVRAAVVAAHLDAHHAMALVDDTLDHFAVDRLEVARPAAPGVELRVRLEQRSSAADAVVLAGVPVIPVLAAEGPFGGGMARHFELHGVELGPPFGLA